MQKTPLKINFKWTIPENKNWQILNVSIIFERLIVEEAFWESLQKSKKKKSTRFYNEEQI